MLNFTGVIQFNTGKIKTVDNDPYTILLNRTGDTALTWSDPNDIKVLTYFEHRMAEGYVFFVIDPEFAKTMHRVKRLTSTNEVGSARRVYMDDQEAERLFQEHVFDLVTLDKQGPLTIETAQKAKTPAEAASKPTVGTRALSGG